jgi:disulfide bond formation protein DsbB
VIIRFTESPAVFCRLCVYVRIPYLFDASLIWVYVKIEAHRPILKYLSPLTLFVASFLIIAKLNPIEARKFALMGPEKLAKIRS